MSASRKRKADHGREKGQGSTGNVLTVIDGNISFSDDDDFDLSPEPKTLKTQQRALADFTPKSQLNTSKIEAPSFFENTDDEEFDLTQVFDSNSQATPHKQVSEYSQWTPRKQEHRIYPLGEVLINYNEIYI